MAKFIKLHMYVNNAPIVINIDHIISVVHTTKDVKGKQVTTATVLIDAKYNGKEYDVTVNESAEKVFNMINDINTGVQTK